MSEKWFVVSESELKELKDSAQSLLTYDADDGYGLMKAEAACRARPFEKYQAVVEAAKGLPQTEWALMEALAALEEDV